MTRRRIYRGSAAAGAAAAIFIAVMGAAPATALTSSQSDALGAVLAANPALSNHLSTQRIDQGRLAADFGRIEVTVATDAHTGVSLTKDDGAIISLGLPFASQASRGIDAGSGTVLFDNGNGSSTVVVVVDDGSAAIHSVIEGPEAPVEYPYDLRVPAGASLSLLDSGQVLVLDQSGASVFFIGAPWATDATGRNLETHYEIRGERVVQVVEHKGAVYPVVADPAVGGFYMQTYQWNSAHNRLTLWPTLAGGTFPYAVVTAYGWNEVVNAPGIGSLSESLRQQFGCHAYGNAALWAAGQTWDLETWRGTVSNPIAWWSSLCNW